MIPEGRGRGLARRMLAALEEVARAAGPDQVGPGVRRPAAGEAVALSPPWGGTLAT
ncbi:N-acetyltransferase [Streptomyces badius]